MRDHRAPLATAVAVVAIVLTAVGLTGLGRDSSSRAPGATLASSPATVVNGVDQSVLQACEASGQQCDSVVPGLAQCMAKHLICDQAAADRDKSLTLAQTQASALTTTAATAAAMHLALNAATATVAWVRQETASSLISAGVDLSKTAPVTAPLIVVAINGDAMTDGSPGAAPKQVSKFAVIYDSSTHEPVMTCLGDFCGLS